MLDLAFPSGGGIAIDGFGHDMQCIVAAAGRNNTQPEPRQPRLWRRLALLTALSTIIWGAGAAEHLVSADSSTSTCSI